jgi:hypothetical protein
MNNSSKSLSQKSRLATNAFLILSLTLCSPKTLADQKLDLSCLDRISKERVANCFDENFVCQLELKSAAHADQSKTPEIVIAVLVGIAAGILLDKQLHF